MQIIDIGMAGTLESSDVVIRIEKNPNKGIEIYLKSSVENQFGLQIRKVIQDTLAKLGISDVIVDVNDKGALDCTIEARVKTAVHRAAHNTEYRWGDR